MSDRKPGMNVGATTQQKQAALELASVHGMRAAGRELGVSHRTISRWISQMPEYWSELQEGRRDAHKIGFAQRLENLAEGYTAAEEDALDRAETLIATADAKELAGLIKAMGSSRQNATVGARALRGEDAEHTELTINVPALEQAMERLLGPSDPEPLQVRNESETHS